VAVIFGGGFSHATGVLVGIGSALAGTVFSILNGRFAGLYHHRVIACYEMLGAAVFCLFCLPLSATWLTDGAGLDLAPGPVDLLWLLVLVFACTVYAYSEYLELLKRVSVFTVSLAYNLEPVYGILLATLVFAEHKVLGGRFYAGSALILAAVAAHPLLERRVVRSVSGR
jgi:drug/metabolite transporter (DMT)-like permease